MVKIAYLFPGQGSHIAGMGRDLYENFNLVRTLYEKGTQKLREVRQKHNGNDVQPALSLDELCFNPNGSFSRTINVQPAVLTASYAAFKALEEICGKRQMPIKPDYFIGQSLGQWTALAAAGVLEYRAVLEMVYRRAKLMEETVGSLPPSGLMAIISKGNSKLNLEEINDMCSEYGVELSLKNSPRQAVIGGTHEQLNSLSSELNNGKRTKWVNKRYPFHTSSMEEPALAFRPYLDDCRMKPPSSPIILNVSAEPTREVPLIKDDLVRHIYSPVDFAGSVERAAKEGVTLFVEFGPRQYLKQMVLEINPYAAVLSVFDRKSLESAVAKLRKHRQQS